MITFHITITSVLQDHVFNAICKCLRIMFLMQNVTQEIYFPGTHQCITAGVGFHQKVTIYFTYYKGQNFQRKDWASFQPLKFHLGIFHNVFTSKLTSCNNLIDGAATPKRINLRKSTDIVAPYSVIPSSNSVHFLQNTHNKYK